MNLNESPAINEKHQQREDWQLSHVSLFLFLHHFLTHLYASGTSTHDVATFVYNRAEIVATVFIRSTCRHVFSLSIASSKVNMQTQTTYSSETDLRKNDKAHLPSTKPLHDSTAEPLPPSPFALTIKGVTRQLSLEHYQRLSHKINQIQQIELEESLVRQAIQRLHEKKLHLRTLLDDLLTSESDDESSDYASS